MVVHTAVHTVVHTVVHTALLPGTHAEVAATQCHLAGPQSSHTAAGWEANTAAAAEQSNSGLPSTAGLAGEGQEEEPSSGCPRRESAHGDDGDGR